MKKTILLIAVLVSAGLCVESVGMYENNYLIKADNYIIQLPEMLSVPSTIDNSFRVSLVPRITVGDSVVSIAPSISGELIQGRRNKLSFKVEAEKNNVKILQEIEIHDEFVKTRTTIQNTGSENMPVEVIFNVNSENSAVIFPSVHTGKITNYIIMTDESLEGSSLGISSDSDIDTGREISFIRNASSYTFGAKTEALGKGQKLALTVVYYPFDLRKEGSRPYPLSAAPFLENTLIKTEGTVNYNLSSDSPDKIDRLLESVANQERRETGTFINIYSPNLEIPKDSLGMSAYFKKLCRENDLPCRLKIGSDGREKYAWISAYFGKWQDVDIYQGVKIRPSGYSVIYEDPSRRVVTYNPDDEEKSIFLQTRFIGSAGRSYFAVYIILIVIAAFSALAILQWKANFFTKIIEKNRKAVLKGNIRGEYSVIRESIPDKFLNEVLQAVGRKKGKVDVSELSEDLRYSEELISFAVSYLSDSGYITKTGEIESSLPVIVSEKETAKPFRKTLMIAALMIAAALLIILLLI